MIRTLIHVAAAMGVLLFAMPLRGSSACSTSRNALEEPLALRLSMSATQVSRPIAQRRLLLEVENTGDRRIYLDEKRLESPAMIRVFDRTGAEVSYLHDSAESQYSKKDIARLDGHTRIVWPFQLSDLTADSLDLPPYMIVCSYDNTDAEYPEGLHFDRLKAESGPFYLTK